MRSIWDSERKRCGNKYKKCLVTYVDILGFKNMVKANPKNSLIIETVLDAFEEFKLDSVLAPQPIKIYYFSDLVVRVRNIADMDEKSTCREIYFEIMALSLLQANLIGHHVTVRGYVEIGDLFENDKMIFGNALINAYLNESNKVVYPVIGVSDAIMDYYRGTNDRSYWTYGLEFSTFITNYNHDIQYIDYINAMVILFSPPVDGRFNNLLENKRLIKLMIHDRHIDQRVRQKYEWLKEYHNMSVMKLPKVYQKYYLIS